MSLLLRELVPEARSRCSTRPVAKPRVTASSAVPGAHDAAADHQDVELSLGRGRRHCCECGVARRRAERAGLGHPFILPEARIRWADGLFRPPRSCSDPAAPAVTLRTDTGGRIRTYAGIGLVTSLTLAVACLGTFALVDDGRPGAPEPAGLALVAFETGGRAPGSAEGPSAPDKVTQGPASAAADVPARRSATVVLSGDLLWHDTVWQSAAADHARSGAGGHFDFDPMFAALRPMVEAADLAVCHEEVPFAAPGAPYRSYPVFAAPPEIAVLDRLDGVGRVHDRVEPRGRPGVRRAGPDRRPAGGRRGRARRYASARRLSGVARRSSRPPPGCGSAS